MFPSPTMPFSCLKRQIPLTIKGGFIGARQEQLSKQAALRQASKQKRAGGIRADEVYLKTSKSGNRGPSYW